MRLSAQNGLEMSSLLIGSSLLSIRESRAASGLTVLNDALFTTLAEAKIRITAWNED
jgi:hypothetical protein